MGERVEKVAARAAQLKPVWVVVYNDALKFEDECQELTKKGYKLVTASCGSSTGSEFDAPEPHYQAIFALPGAVIGSPCAAKKLRWCPHLERCIYRDADGTCTSPNMEC